MLLGMILFSLLVLPSTAQEPESKGEIPPALTEYKGRKIAQTMHFFGANWLTRESRQREEDCATMLRELKVKPGMTICDMGCGNGFYTLQMAEQVGKNGEILAVDIQSQMLRLMEARAAEKGIKNCQKAEDRRPTEAGGEGHGRRGDRRTAGAPPTRQTWQRWQRR